MLAAVGKDRQLTPPGIHAHGGQGVEVFPLSALPAVGHKVHLQEARSCLVPVREGPHRNLVLKGGSRAWWSCARAGASAGAGKAGQW